VISVASRLGDRIGVSNESLHVLERMIIGSTGPDLQRLGLELTSMRDAVRRLS